jgi:hypothetical protein
MQPNALLIRQNFIVIKSGCYIEHRLPIKVGFRSYKQGAGDRWKGEGGGGSVVASRVHTTLLVCKLGL